MAISLNTFAYEEIFLIVNGKKIEADAPAFIENDRTLVPIRFVSEALGYDVFWGNDLRKITIIKDDAKDNESKKIELVIDKDRANLYDNKDVKKETTLDVPAKIVKDRTFVPIRFVAENFGTKVDWDSENRAVIIGDASKYNKEEITKLRAEASSKADTNLIKDTKDSNEPKLNNKENLKGSIINENTKDFSGRYVNLEWGFYTLTLEKSGDYYIATAYRKESNGEEQEISNVTLKMNADGKSGVFISPGEQEIMNENPVVFGDNCLNFGDAKYIKANKGTDISYDQGNYYVNDEIIN